MLSFGKPSSDSIQRFLVAQSQMPFSYSEVGATDETLPTGYRPLLEAALAAIEQKPAEPN